MASPDKKAYLLRLPHEVWEQIERLAAAELRSVNGQIEWLLREALARRMGAGNEPGAASDRSSGARKSQPKNKR